MGCEPLTGYEEEDWELLKKSLKDTTLIKQLRGNGLRWLDAKVCRLQHCPATRNDYILYPCSHNACKTHSSETPCEIKKRELVNGFTGILDSTTTVFPWMDVCFSLSISCLLSNISKQLFEDYCNNNTASWVEDKISAKNRRVLMTKWAGNAWDQICQQNTEPVKQATYMEFQPLIN